MVHVWVAILSLFGATEIWTESSLVQVLPESGASAEAEDAVRLHAARGERESFQVCVRARRKPLENVGIVAGRLDDAIGPPEVRRVGFLHVANGSPRAVAPQALWPDPLLDFQPFDLAPGETAALWLTYHVPREAEPGTHKGNVAVVLGKHRRRLVPVTIYVFDFTLPETPTLRTAFPLDRAAVRAVYGLEDDALLRWQSIYRALAHARISFRLWDAGDLVPISKNGVANTTRFKEHLAYAVNAAGMNSIDIGAGPQGIAPFPSLRPGARQDPLEFYLRDMADWLEDRGWLARAYLEVMPLGDRSGWQDVRDAYARVQRADTRVARMLAGPLHPDFERCSDIWAVPLRHFNPYADAALQQGRSLCAPVAQPARSVMASSSGRAPDAPSYATRPQDAYDGCMCTSWASASSPTPGSPEWINIDLEKPVTTSSLKIVWRTGFESTNIDVTTTLGDATLVNTAVQWQHHPPTDPYTQSWAEGSFRKALTFRSIRLTFSGTFAAGPVSITEIMLARTPAGGVPQRIKPVQTWLYSEAGGYPSFCADAHPVEARIFPWVCWGHNAAGFACSGLNRWPEAWVQQARTQPLVWSGGGAGESLLFYPGPRAPMPSVRSERLRDGIEDYEYLALLQRAVRAQEVTDRDVLKSCRRELHSIDTGGEALDDWMERIQKDRVKIGWALSALARKGLP